MNDRDPFIRRALLLLATIVLVGSLVRLLIFALQGDELLKLSISRTGTVVTAHDPRPWLIAATAAAALLLAAGLLAEWRLRALRRLAESEQAAQAAASEAQRAARESELRASKLARERDEEQKAHRRAADGWEREREWNRQLREQIVQLQRRSGLFGRTDDIRQMVLALTLELVEAEKGILLSDQNLEDGRMRVVASSGFAHDPQQSALAQRFAGEVIARGTTVREDDRAAVDADGRTPADEEVQNLLAIPMYLADEFSGVLVCANRQGGFDTLDHDVLVAVGDHAGAVLQNSRLHGDLRNAYISTIRVLANAIELKDPELRGHSDHVSGYVRTVADRLELDPREREELIFASLLHDVGKLGISERILLKPAALTDEERSVIQLHPRIGYQLVRQVPALESLAPAVLHHHERFDGEGYPGRLRGEAIPLSARIIAIADTFSAITTDRPYSRGRSVEEACQELERCAGGQFDPEVVKLFVEAVRTNPEPDVAAVQFSPDAELELQRDGDFVLGARAFGITDSLTMLYSHRHLHDTARAFAQRAELQGGRPSLVLAELVKLREINQERGFAAGDEAIQSVARVFQSAAGRCGGLAFRESGRRIALLCPEQDADELDIFRQRLLAELEAGPKVNLTVAAWNPDEEAEALIERALDTLRAARSVPV